MGIGLVVTVMVEHIKGYTKVKLASQLLNSEVSSVHHSQTLQSEKAPTQKKYCAQYFYCMQSCYKNPFLIKMELQCIFSASILSIPG